MSQRAVSYRWLLPAVLGLLAVGACSSGRLLGPENQVQVTNELDTFEWQATAMQNVKQTLVYSWQNTGTTANVNQSSSITAADLRSESLGQRDVRDTGSEQWHVGNRRGVGRRGWCDQLPSGEAVKGGATAGRCWAGRIDSGSAVGSLQSLA